MMTLYQLADEYTKAFDNIVVDEETGEVTGIEDLLAIEDEYDHKAINCALQLKNLAAEAKAIATEENELKKRRKALEVQAERLKFCIVNCMEKVGKDKLKDARASLTLRDYPHVEITDADAIPSGYIKVKVERSPMKAEISKAIKAGMEIAGAKLVTSRSVSIK